MQADLNALIAQKALGWTVTAEGYQTPEGIRPFAAFQPCNDIGAAWAVLEQVKEHCQLVSIRWVRGNHWMVEFAGYGADGTKLGRDFSTSPARAICQALVQVLP
jgi:hypothetical protein